MKFFFLLVATLALGLLVYWIALFYQKAQVGKILAKKTVSFQNVTQEYRKTLLVLGDSTAVGVGAATPPESVAGLLSEGIRATYTENLGVSGAVVADVPQQIAQAKLAHYDLILIQIGANDVIRFHDVNTVSVQLGTILDSLTQKSEKIILMPAGDVGGATIFPPPLRSFYTTLNLKYHASFGAVARIHGATYINLYSPPAEDLFRIKPELYFATDGLHPSSAGYLLWYKRLQETTTL